MSFEFAQSFCIQFRASRYITWLNRPSELKINFIEFPRASVYNFEHLEILRDSIGHPSKKLLSLEFPHSFCIQFRASRCITRLDQTSVLKVIVVWICLELLYSISSVSIYYVTQSGIRVKNYFCWISQSFCIQFRASRNITRLNWTSK